MSAVPVLTASVPHPLIDSFHPVDEELPQDYRIICVSFPARCFTAAPNSYSCFNGSDEAKLYKKMFSFFCMLISDLSKKDARGCQDAPKVYHEYCPRASTTEDAKSREGKQAREDFYDMACVRLYVAYKELYSSDKQKERLKQLREERKEKARQKEIDQFKQDDMPELEAVDEDNGDAKDEKKKHKGKSEKQKRQEQKEREADAKLSDEEWALKGLSESEKKTMRMEFFLTGRLGKIVEKRFFQLQTERENKFVPKSKGPPLVNQDFTKIWCIEELINMVQVWTLIPNLSGFVAEAKRSPLDSEQNPVNLTSMFSVERAIVKHMDVSQTQCSRRNYFSESGRFKFADPTKVWQILPHYMGIERAPRLVWRHIKPKAATHGSALVDTWTSSHTHQFQIMALKDANRLNRTFERVNRGNLMEDMDLDEYRGLVIKENSGIELTEEQKQILDARTATLKENAKIISESAFESVLGNAGATADQLTFESVKAAVDKKIRETCAESKAAFETRNKPDNETAQAAEAAYKASQVKLKSDIAEIRRNYTPMFLNVWAGRTKSDACTKIEEWGTAFLKKREEAGKAKNFCMPQKKQKVTRNGSYFMDMVVFEFLFLEYVMGLSHNHVLFFTGKMSIFQVYAQGKFHFNMMLYGGHGAGKSHILNALAECCIPGSVSTLAYTSAKADVVDGNYNDTVRIYGEAPPEQTGTNNKKATGEISSAEAWMNFIMTSDTIEAKVFKLDEETNSRTAQHVKAQSSFVFLMATNANPYLSMTLPQLSRWYAKQCRQDKVIYKAIIEKLHGRKDKEKRAGMLDEFKERMMRDQYFSCLIWKAILSGVLPPINMECSAVMFAAVLEEGRKLGMSNTTEARHLERLEFLVSELCIWEATSLALDSVMGKADFDKPYDIEVDIHKIAPYLVVTTEHAIMALTLCQDQFESDALFTVVNLLANHMAREKDAPPAPVPSSPKLTGENKQKNDEKCQKEAEEAASRDMSNEQHSFQNNLKGNKVSKICYEVYHSAADDKLKTNKHRLTRWDYFRSNTVKDFRSSWHRLAKILHKAQPIDQFTCKEIESVLLTLSLQDAPDHQDIHVNPDKSQSAFKMISYQPGPKTESGLEFERLSIETDLIRFNSTSRMQESIKRFLNHKHSKERTYLTGSCISPVQPFLLKPFTFKPDVNTQYELKMQSGQAIDPSVRQMLENGSEQDLKQVFPDIETTTVDEPLDDFCTKRHLDSIGADHKGRYNRTEIHSEMIRVANACHPPLPSYPLEISTNPMPALSGFSDRKDRKEDKKNNDLVDAHRQKHIDAKYQGGARPKPTASSSFSSSSSSSYASVDRTVDELARLQLNSSSSIPRVVSSDKQSPAKRRKVDSPSKSLRTNVKAHAELDDMLGTSDSLSVDGFDPE